jgi:hypothetical protein
VGWGELTEQHVARLNETRGLFVIAGSGYFFFGPDNELPRRIERDIELIRQMTCARIVYGPGVNQIRIDGTLRPLDPDTVAPRSLGMLRELAAQMDLVAVRDQSSRDLLAAVHRGPVRLIGDPAVFMSPTHRPEARAGRQPALVGLNFALHGPNSAANLPTRMRWIVPLVRRMREAWQCRFRYVMHSDVERVFPLLLRQHGIETEVIDAPVQATLDAYTALDLHVCQIMHSSILAVAAGTPVINIGYDVKNQEFFRLMGIADLCFEPKDLDPERVFERAARLYEERAAFAAAIGAAKRRLGEELAAFHAEILALMAESPERAGVACCGRPAPGPPHAGVRAASAPPDMCRNPSTAGAVSPRNAGSQSSPCAAADRPMRAGWTRGRARRSLPRHRGAHPCPTPAAGTLPPSARRAGRR